MWYSRAAGQLGTHGRLSPHLVIFTMIPPSYSDDMIYSNNSNDNKSDDSVWSKSFHHKISAPIIVDHYSKPKAIAQEMDLNIDHCANSITHLEGEV